MRPGMLSRVPARNDAERKLVEFWVGDLRCGADIMRVREIVNPRRLVSAPSAPAFLIGVADHRSAVVPVIDLSLRLGMEATVLGRRSKWIIASAGGMDAGLLVDRVIGVAPVSAADLRETHPMMEPGGDDSWVANVYGLEDGLIFEIDLDRLVGSAAGWTGRAGGEP